MPTITGLVFTKSPTAVHVKKRRGPYIWPRKWEVCVCLIHIPDVATKCHLTVKRFPELILKSLSDLFTRVPVYLGDPSFKVMSIALSYSSK